MMRTAGRRLWVVIAAVASVAVLASMRAGAASSCEFDGVERVVAVGDVHGAYDRYTEILRVAGVVDSGGRWSGGRTHLVQVGDMVDRGDDSRKVLDFLRRLERDAQSSGGRVHILLGNHEVARMLGDLRLTTPGEYAAFATPDSSALRDRFLRSANVAGDAERDAL